MRKGGTPVKVMVIDGQGGGLGRQLVAAIKARLPQVTVLAVGTNSAATTAMLRAGADQAATGENAVVVGSRSADAIVGPVGIVIADAMLGEITPQMAVTVGQSQAGRVLIPVSQCDNIVAGAQGQPMAKLVQSAVDALEQLGACPQQ